MRIAPAARTPLCKPMRILAAVFLTTGGKKGKRIAPGSELHASEKLAMKPGTRVVPVAVGRCGRHAEGLAGLVHGQSREVTQFDQPGRGRIPVGQLCQGVIESQQLVRRSGGSQVNGINVESLAAAAAFFGALLPRRSMRMRRIASAAAAKKCPRLSQRCSEHAAASPVPTSRMYASCTRRRRLKGLAGLFLGQLPRRQLAQLLVNQRQELLGGMGIALLDAAQDARELVHAVQV